MMMMMNRETIKEPPRHTSFFTPFTHRLRVCKKMNEIGDGKPEGERKALQDDTQLTTIHSVLW